MQKCRILLMIATLFSTTVLFAADEDMALSGKPCAAIADACVKAGFTREGADGKKFWMDCMKPVLLHKGVQNVSVDPAAAKACRMYKIEELKKQAAEFEAVSQ
jgi:hypothetical protein